MPNCVSGIRGLSGLRVIQSREVLSLRSAPLEFISSQRKPIFGDHGVIPPPLLAFGGEYRRAWLRLFLAFVPTRLWSMSRYSAIHGGDCAEFAVSQATPSVPCEWGAR